LCKYESLRDGSLSLYDAALLNDALDLREENERRYRQSLEKDNKRGR
jgi:hypothetical protein